MLSFSSLNMRQLGAAIMMPLVLTACTTSNPQMRKDLPAQVHPADAARYAAVENEKFPVPAVALKHLKPQYMRNLVDYQTDEMPGTVVIDPQNKYLYLVQENGKALRYGVGVGKAGLEFTGSANIAYKREWPNWTPTPDMIRRNPELYKPLAGGMPGGEKNPLGARALYLFKDGKDTLYRIHGTNEPWTIGQAMSSGCIRMMNQDVMDLYTRIPNGAKVVVL